MSAWMVSREHVDLMVALAIDGPRDSGHWLSFSYMHEGRCVVVEKRDADRIGQMLADECLSSIHHRYPDCIEQPEDTPRDSGIWWDVPYRQHWLSYRVTAVEALKLIDCYEYQACEHDAWETSEAAAFCRALRSRCSNRVPGYEEAPWGWDIETVRARAATEVPS